MALLILFLTLPVVMIEAFLVLIGDAFPKAKFITGLLCLAIIALCVYLFFGVANGKVSADTFVAILKLAWVVALVMLALGAIGRLFMKS